MIFVPKEAEIEIIERYHDDEKGTLGKHEHPKELLLSGNV
jgi:hypothetical protein